ncbi:MAG: hypoxanthine phosphoribosyltransferase [Saccharofermentans sp.]|nr:hypoxanthine phosphoribosyltransferase [Saccharofermentans sp.]
MTDVLDGSLSINKIVYDRDVINQRVLELGKKITEDYHGEEVVLIGVIKGALYFFSDLTKAIDLPIKIDMIGFGNIPDTTSKTGVVRITKDIDVDITDKHVIIVEDVIRTGLTTAYLSSCLESKKPKDISLCTLLLNPNRLLMTIPVKYYGFEIDDRWLIGYGLDNNEIGRNLPYIAELSRKD